tara:strand:+ start:387 stop:605 length:219 start_codon:yes stop_codon:yes gene_type:complete
MSWVKSLNTFKVANVVRLHAEALVVLVQAVARSSCNQIAKTSMAYLWVAVNFVLQVLALRLALAVSLMTPMI